MNPLRPNLSLGEDCNALLATQVGDPVQDVQFTSKGTNNSRRRLLLRWITYRLPEL
jgi:hypothetical protein